VLDAMHRALGIDVLIEGDARGADRIAGYWARKNRVINLKFRADWNAHGKAAGAIRNQQMLDEGKPTHVLAFPGGRGTADMVRRAVAACVPVVTVTAQGIDTRSGGTEGSSPKGESPVPKECAHDRASNHHPKSDGEMG
jgi:predicted polyphosphate/ATP-dependent NAD kinase